jgi:hypothetical protein
MYLAGLWLDGIGCDVPARVFPAPADYFMQVAALFPDAATAVSEFRAEGWLCEERRWQEVDTRPYFPIDPNDKENRFQRALHFFREQPAVTRALDAYLADRHNTKWREDGIPRGEAIGGVHLLLVRAPIPRPGAPLERFTRRPLESFTSDEKHVFYRTPKSKLEQRCGYDATEEFSP